MKTGLAIIAIIYQVNESTRYVSLTIIVLSFPALPAISAAPALATCKAMLSLSSLVSAIDAEPGTNLQTPELVACTNAWAQPVNRVLPPTRLMVTLLSLALAVNALVP